MAEYKLSQIAKTLGLTLKGDDAVVRGLNTLEAAGPDELSFLSNPKYSHFLSATKACAVIVSQEHADGVSRALISDMPYRDFGRALAMFARPEGAYSGVSEAAFIDPTAKIGLECTVYPTAYVGPGAEIGDHCKLFPGVYIGENCRVGAGTIIYPGAVLMSAVETGVDCVIHAGVVLGAEGFGFTRVEGGIQKIPQAGFTRLGDRVEVGPNSSIDRGALGPTSVGDDTKVDNLVQIGHNVVIGRQNLIVAQVGIAGSTKIGDGNTLAGQAGLSGHLKIGNNTIIGPQAGVAQDVPDNYAGSGTPMVDRRTFLRNAIIMQRLPALDKQVKQLEKEVAELKAALVNKQE